MRSLRCLTVSLAALCLVCATFADFRGPTPLAWRWAQPTTAPPGGYLVDETSGSIYIASGNRVMAIDKATGNFKWRFPQVEPIQGAFRARPVRVGNVIVAMADNSVVFGIDPVTGEEKWQYRTLVPTMGQHTAVANWVVFAMSDNSMMALNAENGQAVWDQPYKIFDGLNPNLAAFDTNVLYLTNTFKLVSLNVASRRETWRRPATFGFVNPNSKPVVFGDSVYVNTATFVSALNAATGRARWQVNVGEPLEFSPGVSSIGVVAVSQSGKVYRISEPGRLIGRTPIDLGSLPATDPSCIGRFFMVPTTNGTLNLIDAQSGEIVWSYLVRPLGETTVRTSGTSAQNQPRGGGSTSQTETRVYTIRAAAPAVLSGNTMLLLAQDGSLLAFDQGIGVDLTPPSVTMAWPNPGDQVSGQPPLELIFRIEDEASGVNESTIQITVNGKVYAHEYGRDGFAIVRVSNFTENKPLENGRQSIKVKATDWLGNTVEQEFVLTVDNLLRPVTRPGTEGSGTGTGTGTRPGNRGGRTGRP